MSATDPAVTAAAEAIDGPGSTYLIQRGHVDIDDVARVVAAVRPIIEAEVRRSLLWECPDCAFGFDRMHTDEDGGYTCPVCEVAEVRERIAADIEAEAQPARRSA